jgi:hypothetical protein
MSKEYLRKNFGNPYDAIEYVETLRRQLQFPTRPTKPSLSVKHTVEDVMEYGKKLEQYEEDMSIFRIEDACCKSNANKLESDLLEYLKEECGFYLHVPLKNQEKVWNKAWSDGHSDGYYSVYRHLSELVDLFIV